MVFGRGHLKGRQLQGFLSESTLCCLKSRIFMGVRIRLERRKGEEDNYRKQFGAK